MRRLQVPLLFVLHCLLLVATAFAAPEADKGNTLRITHGPYLMSPRSTSVTVVWFTNRKCVSWVEYGEGETLSSKAISVHDGLIDADDTRHVITLDGLAPGKAYRYRVVSKEIVKFGPYHVDYGETATSDAFSFSTCDPKKEKFTFDVVSDIHGNAACLKKMLDEVTWSDVDLMFLDGDMISHFEQPEQIFDGFLDVRTSSFARCKPFVYVRGNHETRGLLARRLSDYLPTPEQRFYGSFNHGGVHFIVLDSGEDKKDTSIEYSGLVAFDPYRRKQADWLREDIRSEACRGADFRVALFHMPTYGGNDWHGERQIRELWGPLLNDGSVELAICGHTHKANHLVARSDANRYDVVICSPESMIQVQVTRECLAVSWKAANGEKMPASFTIVRNKSQK